MIYTFYCLSKDWRQEGKETTEDEMVGWHHQLDAHEFEKALGVGDGQRGLACCSPWGCKELDKTERLNWTEWWVNSFTCRVFFLNFRKGFVFDQHFMVCEGGSFYPILWEIFFEHLPHARHCSQDQGIPQTRRGQILGRLQTAAHLAVHEPMSQALAIVSILAWRFGWHKLPVAERY